MYIHMFIAILALNLSNTEEEHTHINIFIFLHQHNRIADMQVLQYPAKYFSQQSKIIIEHHYIIYPYKDSLQLQGQHVDC